MITAGYTSPTEAVNTAFENLLEDHNYNNSGSQEIPVLKARLEEKDKQIEELNKHNSTLKEDLDKASQDKEDLKAMHNNYFLQVQTLINQKAIKAPGKKKWYKFW
jgi:predicted nuclease with TOPRIM domain